MVNLEVFDMHVEANINLISLDGGISRSFTLASNGAVRHSIGAGRASRTRDGGLLPGEENLWIESPIVSREHATLCIRRFNEWKLCIVDLKSTHGTFVNGEKVIDARPLQHKDIIKFGEMVVTPIETFYPKEFRLEYHWNEWRVPTPRPSPERSDKPTGYRFPSISDSSDSSDCEGFEAKRSPSLELVSSTPTKGTNGNEVIFLSQSRVQHRSYPSGQNHIDLTAHESPVPSDSRNGSSMHPIALEADTAITDSSDDEGPEVIIMRCRKPFNAPPSSVPLAQPTAAETELKNQGTPDMEESRIIQEPSPPEEVSRELTEEKAVESTGSTSATPMQEQAKDEGGNAESNMDNPTDLAQQPSVDDYYSEVSEQDEYEPSLDRPWTEEPSDEHWSDDQEESEEHEYPGTPCESCCGTGESEGNATDSECDDDQGNLSDSSSDAASVGDLDAGHETPQPALSSTALPQPFVVPQSVIELARADHESSVLSQASLAPDSLDVNPSIPRPPSPSDAALARSSNTTVPAIPNPFSAMRHEHSVFPQHQYSLHCSTQNPYSTRPANPWNCQSVMEDTYRRHTRSWDYDEPPVYTNYTDGPFARSQGYQPDYSTRYPSRAPYLEQYYGGDQLVDIEFGPLGSRSSSQNVDPDREKSRQKTSRVPISDIVNVAPPANTSGSTSRSLKRKADEISDDENSMECTKSTDPSAISGICDSIDYPVLPDAQPRGRSVSILSVDPEFLDTNDLVPTEHETTQSPGIILRPETKVTEEPARKRVKLTRKSKTFLRTFASGCLAGAITAVGVAAAFVATIPASVQDEALRTF